VKDVQKYYCSVALLLLATDIHAGVSFSNKPHVHLFLILML
jgi:hypothetical protein